MTSPFQACYSDLKIVKTRKVAQIILEVPVEQTAEIVSYLGIPISAKEVWVAVAKLNMQSQTSYSEVFKPDSQRAQTALETQENANQYGQQAKALVLSGFFRHLDVWKEIASEDEYFAWLREQPSAWSKNTPCVVAHVRRVSHGAGTGIKPPYFAVPLTHEEHQIQHQHGESALMPPEDFETYAMRYLETYMRNKFKQLLGYESLANIPPDVILAWCEATGLTKFLPTCYKQ